MVRGFTSTNFSGTKDSITGKNSRIDPPHAVCQRCQSQIIGFFPRRQFQSVTDTDTAPAGHSDAPLQPTNAPYDASRGGYTALPIHPAHPTRLPAPIEFFKHTHYPPPTLPAAAAAHANAARGACGAARYAARTARSQPSHPPRPARPAASSRLPPAVAVPARLATVARPQPSSGASCCSRHGSLSLV